MTTAATTNNKRSGIDVTGSWLEIKRKKERLCSIDDDSY